MKCPMCLNGEVIIGDSVGTDDRLMEKMYGSDAHYATCSVCTAGGVVAGELCLSWLVRAINLKPITETESS